MVHYPICPKCTNTGLSIVELEVDNHKLKGVQCNNCKQILWIFQDMTNEMEELTERIDKMEGDISDLDDSVSYLSSVISKL